MLLKYTSAYWNKKENTQNGIMPVEHVMSTNCFV